MLKEKVNNIKCSKTKVIICISIAILLVGVFLLLERDGVSGEKKVSFDIIKEKNIPNNIKNEIIPQYKTVERALACRIDDDIYVIVTRGEKPTTSFEVSIDKITIEQKEDKKNLIVYALFKDPDKKTAISNIITYPVCVAKTDLSDLPDSIELRIQY